MCDISALNKSTEEIAKVTLLISKSVLLLGGGLTAGGGGLCFLATLPQLLNQVEIIRIMSYGNPLTLNVWGPLNSFMTLSVRM